MLLELNLTKSPKAKFLSFIWDENSLNLK